jgi:cell division septum initiation protein DivIVA
MTWLEWLLQLLVVVLLLAALPFVVRLHRQLRALRQEGAGFAGTAAGLNEATRQAEAASLRLRGSAETAGRQVSEKLAGAEALRDDLRYLVERAETVADRLEGLVRHARPLAEAPAPPAATTVKAEPAAEPPAGQSQAERDLLRALVRGAAAREAAR